MFDFVKSFVGVKTDQAVKGAVQALVNADPQGATEAELRVMEKSLDQLGRQVAEARQQFDREHKEAEAIAALSAQRMAAAEQLGRQLDAEQDPTRKAAIERSMTTLLGMLEEMAPEVDREKQDAVDAKEFLDMLQETYQKAGDKLKTHRAELQRGQREVGRSEQQREIAARRAEAARQAAGLTGATSGIGVALKAMQDTAARNLAEAEAANAKAKLLTPSKPEKDDPILAEAMRAASGKGPSPTSLTDRLAALKAR